MICHCLGQTKLPGVWRELVEALLLRGLDDASGVVVVVLIVASERDLGVGG